MSATCCACAVRATAAGARRPADAVTSETVIAVLPRWTLPGSFRPSFIRCHTDSSDMSIGDHLREAPDGAEPIGALRARSVIRSTIGAVPERHQDPVNGIREIGA
ncbi:hypothetical protein chiPu_0032721 [Chiloscyllium punctatum]|uniref:Uncharacterized protein n=1 Tax=Chiloscyllium punctatum TaxID=137246 RepID=A0A401U0P8_CHIPU|nr:hypothetical protein [Chiloscyllium punctatum]